VTSWGSADSWTEPGDSIQIEVDHIWISLDKGHKIKTPSFEITGGLFDAIYERIQEKLYEKVNKDGPPEFEDDWR
jgi:hypothetical protein